MVKRSLGREYHPWADSQRSHMPQKTMQRSRQLLIRHCSNGSGVSPITGETITRRTQEQMPLPSLPARKPPAKLALMPPSLAGSRVGLSPLTAGGISLTANPTDYSGGYITFGGSGSIYGYTGYVDSFRVEADLYGDGTRVYRPHIPTNMGTQTIRVLRSPHQGLVHGSMEHCTTAQIIGQYH